jgi:hypothetical protein
MNSTATIPKNATKNSQLKKFAIGAFKLTFFTVILPTVVLAQEGSSSFLTESMSEILLRRAKSAMIARRSNRLRLISLATEKIAIGASLATVYLGEKPYFKRYRTVFLGTSSVLYSIAFITSYLNELDNN